jgi:hypothetical protein
LKAFNILLKSGEAIHKEWFYFQQRKSCRLVKASLIFNN